MSAYKANPEVFSSLIEHHKELFCGAFAKVSKAALCEDTVFFQTGIFNSESWTNGYAINDPMLENMMIERVGEDEYVATLKDASLSIKATEEERRYYAFSRVKCSFRKTAGSLDKVIKAVKKWQEKRLALVKEYKSEIVNVENSNLKDI
jgi:hypothetical protein